MRKICGKFNFFLRDFKSHNPCFENVWLKHLWIICVHFNDIFLPPVWKLFSFKKTALLHKFMNLVWVSISLWGTFALPGQGYITIRKCARKPRKKTNYNIFSVKTFARQTTAQWKPLNHITFKWNFYFLFLSIQGIHSSEGFGEEVINTCECKTDIWN